MTSDTYYPDIGGAEMHVYYLQKQLRSLGHQITLFVTNPKSSHEDAMYPVIRDRWTLARSPILFWRLWKLSEDIDIIHCHYSYKLACVAGLVAKIRRKPMIITQHGMGLLDQAGVKGIYRFLHSAYRFFSLRLATHTISTSQDLADVHLAFYPKASIEVIPNGIDVSIFEPRNVQPFVDSRLEGAYPVLLTVRRLVPKNGIHFVIPILPILRQVYPNIRYAIVGDGRSRQVIEALIKRYNVADLCVFFGAQSQQQVASIASRADLVLFPSTAESTSLACAEMMAMGKRILASRVGGLIELLGQNEERGWFTKLVDWESSDYDAPETLPEERTQGFASDVVRALKDQRGDEITAAARAYAVHELDWPVIARKTMAVFDRLLTSGS
jgi:glycosyltransferase involved in cell wall biosynthesis